MDIADNFKRRFFYRMHPEAALRYLPIVDLLKKERLENSKILEIGSGSYGITPYLKKEVVGIDMSFDEPMCPLLKQIKGSANNLPFKDEEFDVVVLSDVLEHLPVGMRTKALRETIRVADKLVIISGPFGKEAAIQDRKLADYSMRVLKKVHPFFKDHLKYGLPNITEIEGIARQSQRVKEVKVMGNFLNLKVRERLMKFFITNNKLVFYFYLKGLMLLVPLLRIFNQKPCYRTIILFQLKES